MDNDRQQPVLLPATLQGRWGRRRFLRLAASGAALLPLGILACGDDQPPAESSDDARHQPRRDDQTTAPVRRRHQPPRHRRRPPLPRHQPRAYRSQSPTPAATAPTLSVDLWPLQVGIGESLLVRTTAPAASSVVVTFRDVSLSDGGAGRRRVLARARRTTRCVRWRRPPHLRGTRRRRRDAPEHGVRLRGHRHRPAGRLPRSDRRDGGNTLTPEAAALESQLRGVQFAAFDPLPAVVGLLPATGRRRDHHVLWPGTLNQRRASWRLPHRRRPRERRRHARAAGSAGRVSWTGAMPIRGNSVHRRPWRRRKDRLPPPLDDLGERR